MSTVDDLRQIALSLPETSEKPGWGMPTFRVRGKVFAAVNPKHGVGIPMSRDERAGLVAAEPEKFYWTPHDENYDFMRLHLAAIDPRELRELLTDAWRSRAGARMIARYPDM